MFFSYLSTINLICILWHIAQLKVVNKLLHKKHIAFLPVCTAQYANEQQIRSLFQEFLWPWEPCVCFIADTPLKHLQLRSIHHVHRDKSTIIRRSHLKKPWIRADDAYLVDEIYTL